MQWICGWWVVVVVAMKWREKRFKEALLEREALSRGCGKNTQGKIRSPGNIHILFGGFANLKYIGFS